MAAAAAALTGAGTSKCGWPMLRLIGSLTLRTSSKILRMPEASMFRIRSAIQWSCMAWRHRLQGHESEPPGRARRPDGGTGPAHTLMVFGDGCGGRLSLHFT